MFDEVTFKLHPSEMSKVEFYQTYFDGSKVLVSTQDIYQELNESVTVIGVFSTAMLEAVDFGCEVYFAPLQGSEYVAANQLIDDVTKSGFYING
jgi:lysyl-tRNA synthetase class II